MSVGTALVAGFFLGQVEIDPGTFWDPFVFDGGPSAARSLLEAIVTALITVTSLTFSLMVLVLQNAANRYSPRLLRKFIGDLRHQGALAVFLAAFAFALVVLPRIHEDGEEFVPQFAVTVALLLTIASIGALVMLIYSITQSIRVEAIMRDVERDTVGTIARNHAQLARTGGRDRTVTHAPAEATVVRSRNSGYVQSIDGTRLIALAERMRIVVVYRRTVGEQITKGAPLALAWDPETLHFRGDTDELEKAVNSSVQIGYERTLQEDVAFGLRQLTDVAVKALSSGINDPSTAVDAIGRTATLLRHLVDLDLGAELLAGETGTLRVSVPRPRFADYVELVTYPISLYGGQDKTVIRQLLRMLEDLGSATDDHDRRQAILDGIDRVAVHAHHEMSIKRAIDTMEQNADNARAALRGEAPMQDTFVL